MLVLFLIDLVHAGVESDLVPELLRVGRGDVAPPGAGDADVVGRLVEVAVLHGLADVEAVAAGPELEMTRVVDEIQEVEGLVVGPSILLDVHVDGLAEALPLQHVEVLRPPLDEGPPDIIQHAVAVESLTQPVGDPFGDQLAVDILLLIKSRPARPVRPVDVRVVLPHFVGHQPGAVKTVLLAVDSAVVVQIRSEVVRDDVAADDLRIVGGAVGVHRPASSADAIVRLEEEDVVDAGLG
mmetsp:Transcript_32071/g.68296  ORF Transcript_32071/g.68296 Transcript_32071/m.68296 type:complete len:239 (+) Transcript_32071:1653-2369(+)